MGARNVSACFVMYSDLPHRAFRLLVHMALTSLDDEGQDGRSARRYYGGRDAMVAALGFDVTSAEGLDSGRRAARRVLVELEQAGAICDRTTGANGRRAEYQLALDPLGRRVATTPQQEGRHNPPKEGRHNPPKEGRHNPPKENRGTTEESRHPGQPSPRTSSHLALVVPVDNDGEVDSEYTRARVALDAAGVDRMERALALARENNPAATTREAVLAAAALVTAAPHLIHTPHIRHTNPARIR
jgi:hypothetical protein